MSPDEEIERYLKQERLSAALRLLWIGAVALVLGGAGSLLVYRWWIHGGVLPRVVLASPLLVLTGVPLVFYALLSLARVGKSG